MERQLQDIWTSSLKLIKEEMSELGYKTWIECINPVSINNDIIYLEVPTVFQKDTIEGKYKALIKNSIEQVTRSGYNVDIAVEGTRNNTIKENIIKSSASEDNGENNLQYRKYTFDTFVVGGGNLLAHAAAVAVAESPAESYNPLFLYSGAGLGKTHLMHAIGNHIKKMNPNAKVSYVSSEKFTNQLIYDIQQNQTNEFRNRYRNIDVLMIDDIQFIEGKEQTQSEMFHTFNHLYEAKKQIIISSDKPPKGLITLEERLRSRFEWGLIVDIQQPDLETRVAILKKKIEIENLYVPDEVLAFIADKIVSNIRELEGALTRVVAYSTLTDQKITVEMAEIALKDLISQVKAKVIDSKIIMETVARYYSLKPTELLSNKRSKEIAYPRQIAMYLCRELMGMSLPSVGEAFSGKHYSTVIYACDKIEKDMKNDPEIRRTIDELRKNITGGH